MKSGYHDNLKISCLDMKLVTKTKQLAVYLLNEMNYFKANNTYF